MYLGLTPFPVSTRNSAIAVAHLVSKTGVKQMYVSADPAMQRLEQEANEILAKDGNEFELLPMPNFEDLYGPGGDENLVPMGKVSPNKTCIILHSSGESSLLEAAVGFPRALIVSAPGADGTWNRLYGIPKANQVPGQELQEVGDVCM